MKKRVRIKDIALLAGVSPGTVDRVLHNRGNVSEKARIAIEKVLDEVDYKPNIHLSGLSLKKTYEIIITTPDASPGEYWEKVHLGIRSAINQYESINIKVSFMTYNQYNVYSCQEVFNNIIKEKPDAAIIGPTFNKETKDFTNRLQEKDIPFVFVDSMINETSPLAFYSANHYICGYLTCKLLISLIPNNSDIGVLQAIRIGDQSSNASMQRREGVFDYLKEIHYKNKVHNMFFSFHDHQLNDNNMEKFFNTHNNVKGFIVLNSRGNVVADFLKQNNINDVRLVSLDLTDANVDSLKQGKIDYLIDQNPDYQGYMAMKTLLENLILKIKPNEENFMPLNIVTQETVDLQLEFNLLKGI